jgi:Na+/proline symporter
MEVILSILVALFGIGFGIFMALHDRGRYTQTEPTEKYIKQTRLEGIGLSVLCAVLLVVLLFAPQ